MFVGNYSNGGRKIIGNTYGNTSKRPTWSFLTVTVIRQDIKKKKKYDHGL